MKSKMFLVFTVICVFCFFTVSCPIDETEGIPYSPGKPLLRYSFALNKISGDTVNDDTGKHTGKLMNGASVNIENKIPVLRLDKTGNQYFDFGQEAGDIISNNPDFSISTYVYIEGNEILNGSILWNFSSVENMSGNDTSQYILLKMSPGSTEVNIRADKTNLPAPNPVTGWYAADPRNETWLNDTSTGGRIWIANNNGIGGINPPFQLTNKDGNLDCRGQWFHIIYTHKQNTEKDKTALAYGYTTTNGGNVSALDTSRATGIIYINGVQAPNHNNKHHPKFTAYPTTVIPGLKYNWLGRPSVNGDNYIVGAKYSDFCIFNKALSTTEVKKWKVEIDKKLKALNSYQNTEQPPVDVNLKLQYKFDNSSGNNVLSNAGTYTGQLMNGASVDNENGVPVLKLGPSGNQYFDLGPAAGSIISGSPDFTVSTYVYIDADENIAGSILWNFSSAQNMPNNDTNQFIFVRMGIGSTEINQRANRTDLPAPSPNPNTAWYASDPRNETWLNDTARGGRIWIANNNGLGGTNPPFQLTNPAGDLDCRGQWFHIIYTHKQNTAADRTAVAYGYTTTNGGNVSALDTSRATGFIYINGVQAPSHNNKHHPKFTVYPTSAMPNLVFNWLGRPSVTSDRYMFNTKYADFRIYDKVFSAAEMAAWKTEIDATLAILNGTP